MSLDACYTLGRSGLRVSRFVLAALDTPLPEEALKTLDDASALPQRASQTGPFMIQFNRLGRSVCPQLAELPSRQATSLPSPPSRQSANRQIR